MRIKLPNVAQACDRIGVSDRGAAIIFSTALKYMRIVTPEDSSKIVDRSKIRRERITSHEGISSKKTKVEEHIVLVSGPGHLTPASDKSQSYCKVDFNSFRLYTEYAAFTDVTFQVNGGPTVEAKCGEGRRQNSGR
ncbi:unnamed protein product [Brassicogethes aeneus]|uniref:Uncharacterized protein n=1 Tax=Brassicogethes aeneus TaxID=1431903 RepID=A0A9P0B319_BRAAE|nr:unnamed protein product [Brassicogethes aeneus]